MRREESNERLKISEIPVLGPRKRDKEKLSNEEIVLREKRERKDSLDGSCTNARSSDDRSRWFDPEVVVLGFRE